MATIQKNFNAIVLCTGFIIVICLAFIASKPGYAGANFANNDMGKIWKAQWLSQYEGQRVRITFVQAPTHIANDLNKTQYLDLVDVGPTGIVIGIRPERTIFFPYTQIVTIEPSYNTR